MIFAFKTSQTMLSVIGTMIQQLREESSLSVEELASRTGISADRLVEIETNKTAPSLGVLMKISRALGSRLGTLLDGQEGIGAVITRSKEDSKNVSPHSTDKSPYEHLTFYSLAQSKKDRHMEPLLIEVRPNGEKLDMKSEHEGEEFLYVLEGTVELHYGPDVHRLEVGNSIYYDSLVPHSLQNASDKVSKVLAVTYIPY